MSSGGSSPGDSRLVSSDDNKNALRGGGTLADTSTSGTADAPAPASASAMRLGGSFVVDSSPERSSAGDGTSSPSSSRFTPPAKDAPAMRRSYMYTVQAPALVLTRSSAVSAGRCSTRSSSDADDEHGDQPVAFELPVYRNRCSSGAGGDASASASMVYDRQDDTPVIPLWTEDPTTGHPVSTDCYEYISVGRKDMLMARYYGCGCLNEEDTCDKTDGIGIQHDTNNAESIKTGTGAGTSANAALKTERKHVPAHGKSERLPLCSTCKQIEKWGTTYLSREMIRLTPISNTDGGGSASEHCRKTRFGLAVRGPNAAMVRVDGIPIFDEDSQHYRDAMVSGKDGDGDGNGDGGWVGNADLMAGSVLSIECSPSAANAEGAVPVIGRLAFVLINIDVAIEPGNSIDRDRSVRFDAVDTGDGGDEHASSGDNAPSQPSGGLLAPPVQTTDLDAAIRKGGDDTSGDGNIVDAQIETGNHKIDEKDIATIVLVGKSAKDTSSYSDEEDDDDKEDEPMLLLPTISKPKRKKAESKKNDAIDLTDDSPSDVAVAKSASERGTGTARPPLVVYFLATGRKMSHHRVEKLAQNLREKDQSIEIIDSFRKSDLTHVVIDESVLASQAAEALGFVDEKSMMKVMKRFSLTLVTPKWVFDTDASELRSPPAMNFIWPGLKHSARSKSKKDRREEKSNYDQEASNKKSAFDESMMLSYQPAAQPDDTSVSSRDPVAEKSDEDFASVKRVALSSLDDDDPAARMLKRQKVAARQ